MIQQSSGQQKNVVVIGNGMVGLRMCEQLVEKDLAREYKIVTFCEEPRAAYDRVGLTQFFAHNDAEKLMLARLEWYAENNIDLHLADRAVSIDRQNKMIRSQKGVEIPYDKVVIATGSYPFVPNVPGIKNRGVFVYRTINDLEQIIDYAKHSKKAAVIGGGLLGLEAAKAALDLGLETHVLEFAPRLMPRQIDDAGSKILVQKIEELGVQVHLNKATDSVLGESSVSGIRFQDGEELELDMIIVSAGIRPRDELARECELEVGERGGILVNDKLQTSDPDIYAVGEVALHSGMVYGLVAPGYQMAEVAATHLCNGEAEFSGSDLSTKLKLMGVDVASFGDYEAGPDISKSLTFEDPFNGVYKKLVFNKEGTKLLGGILIGDASDYGSLSIMAKSSDALPCKPHELIVGAGGGIPGGSAADMADDAQICSCNNVSKGQICTAIKEQNLSSVDEIKACTKAGGGCGGCLPLVTDVFKAEMKAAGITVSNRLCEHFDYSRTELFDIIKVKKHKSFSAVIEDCGSGNGCEVCKPAVASILASLWNDHIINHSGLQDTNDRFLANMQRGGLYSIVPRVPGGEITPEKLIVLGEVGKEYGLYTKITGGQRVDLFGAEVHQLPEIWEKLIDAGFESGHAYGKALRTVKSCVGTTWCRYGIGDSVGFAIRLEERYRGIRAPHKLKGGVSGCVRECAEAQSKDFGLIATEHGYNLYICGNGGAKPRHADLFASDLDEETCIKYLDRFLMFYIQTADKLTRTATWLEKLEGGIDYLREVVIEDKLGICDELESMMQSLVDTYHCEWKEVVTNPEKRRLFEQFVNTDEHETSIELIPQRGQTRPVDWAPDFVAFDDIKIPEKKPDQNREPREWVKVGTISDFPAEAGSTVKYGNSQIAVFNFASRGEWYACQQMCPHKKAMVLSRGIIGDAAGIPKVACPLHKKTFSLENGSCLSGESEYEVNVFKVKIDEQDNVYLELPDSSVLDELINHRECAGAH
ncbi:nitrite reductase large subunit NirB [Gimesia maris]|uniref:Nitrite reductase [NAD(P)H] n=1 Tax=Gimesia maris TaxID=122 RepID=A0ABX5YNA3_9PLAN|nr:nitrite reductase large subunit NirB [Gimesia maris]EDL59323.1 nitrite reductase (NAD(P)H) large subunit [Gimesia maris DSM 8797]QEG17113.1 Nitrite reductase [NAD(P)H] [Gimesia maris]